MQNNDVQKQDGLHRTNRILMIIISLLLALVLITTCVLSGAYARYITRKTVGTTITFKKLDMSVDIIVSDDLEAYITTGGGEDTFDIVISNLYMRPGDDFEDALKMTVKGSPVTNANLVIDFKIVYNESSFLIPNGTFSSISGDSYCMPIGFKVGTYNAEDAYTCNYAVEPYSTKNGEAIAQDIEKKIDEITDLSFHEETATGRDYDTAAIKSCEAGKKVVFGENISAVGFGFDWPLEYGEGDTLAMNDRLGTWVSGQYPAHTFDIILTIGIN